MKLCKFIFILFFALTLFFLNSETSYSGAEFDAVTTDNPDRALVGFFDLRERETFVQVTNVDPTSNNIHILIFDVSNNCNENNFFDLFTPNDTHTYNLRDILTNDGNSSGVVLPDNAYGVFIAFSATQDFQGKQMIGNLRIEDNNGYEYRTNLVGTNADQTGGPLHQFVTFNFNTEGGVTLSDILIIPSGTTFEDGMQVTDIDDVLSSWTSVDVDIYDLNENPFSCRKVLYACVNQESSLYEALLEEAASGGTNCDGQCGASVADIEYGINDAIPHSKGGELLCPGNNISEGIVRLEKLGNAPGAEDDDNAIIFIGLNNGNGRGSMDMAFNQTNIF